MVGAKTRASLTSELRRLLPRRGRRGLQKQQSALCQATLSIGPYLLLEGAVPRRRLYPVALGLNAFLETSPKCLSLAS